MKPDLASDPWQMAESRRITRTELALVLLLFLGGTGLRCAYPSRMAVEHFDEGVYASDCWFGPDDDFHYPDQHLYAPPLLPTLVWWSTALLGPSNLAVMLPSLVAGCLTIPLVWWIGRSWFGIPLGFVAAVLATFSDLHILFCRTALTDVLLTFWLLWSVYFFWRALATGGVWMLLAAGLFTGLAWWTKYSGWLPLAIGLSGGLAWWLYSLTLSESQDPNRCKPKVRWVIGRWAIIAVTALLIWSPWWFQLQREGGYAAVAANHRGYVVGLSGWWDSFGRQYVALLNSGGWLTLTGIGLHQVLCMAAACSIWRFEPVGFTWNESGASPRTVKLPPWHSALGMGLILAGMGIPIGGVFQVIFPLGVLVLLAVVRLRPSWRLSDKSAFGSPSIWILLAWSVGLTVTIPLYVAYPRLLLPLLPAGWLSLAAFLFCRWSEHRAISPVTPRLPPPDLALWAREKSPLRWKDCLLPAVGLLLIVVGAPHVAARGVPAWQDRSGIVTVSRQIAATIAAETGSGAASAPGPQAVIYTYADPALLFQLRLAGVETVRPVSSLGFAEHGGEASPVPVYVVVGPQARRTAGFGEQFAKAERQLELVAEFEFSPSDVVLLDNREDQDRPPVPGTGDARPVYRQQLYRVR